MLGLTLHHLLLSISQPHGKARALLMVDKCLEREDISCALPVDARGTEERSPLDVLWCGMESLISLFADSEPHVTAHASLSLLIFWCLCHSAASLRTSLQHAGQLVTSLI